MLDSRQQRVDEEKKKRKKKKGGLEQGVDCRIPWIPVAPCSFPLRALPTASYCLYHGIAMVHRMLARWGTLIRCSVANSWFPCLWAISASSSTFRFFFSWVCSFLAWS